MVPNLTPNLPLPTDSLWKFWALFGLAVFLLCIPTLAYVHYSTNELIYSSAVESVSLTESAKVDPVAARKLEVLNKRLEIALDDRPVLSQLLGTFMAIGLAFSAFGFHRWSQIQPKEDRLLELRVASAEQSQVTSTDYSKRTLH